MKKVWTYFAIGCVVAIIGMFFSDICGDFFNGIISVKPGRWSFTKQPTDS